jgi:hypothetical protein
MQQSPLMNSDHTAEIKYYYNGNGKNRADNYPADDFHWIIAAVERTSTGIMISHKIFLYIKPEMVFPMEKPRIFISVQIQVLQGISRRSAVIAG